MLRALYDQESRKDGKVGAELRRTLEWWLAVLERGLAETHDWQWNAEAEEVRAHVPLALRLDGASCVLHCVFLMCLL